MPWKNYEAPSCEGCSERPRQKSVMECFLRENPTYTSSTLQCTVITNVNCHL
uniref:Uncharacterized protein n=1 Tax=Zea mays TaxID=4577 RepID=C4J7Z4_MAIZE|nr:unknown [Zea mays]